MWERVDALNPDSQCSQKKSSFPRSKGARIGRGSKTPSPSPSPSFVAPVPVYKASTSTSFVAPVPIYHPSPLDSPGSILRPVCPLDYMPKFMKPYIEKYDNVKGDGNCGYRVIAKHMRWGEQNWLMVREKLITE